ncbi:MULTISPECIES: ABC transporter permease [unclassified Paenibacillus]|uniref:ABC transporter permease n=1 Tax=unclassified Paenibacillus TaxID=185978 RepID=UPI000956FA4A|nr:MULTISPECIES: ABC transporter permease [unclassified Paenibacillus]ASS64826.1 ABC transporter permease [Paenibacillus sp. RUD330]SIR04777.1 putative ABC transport system permease protein [Paenibacillus sp. RU4X]SIR30525.1 putative ABC transport system permease protein [Paenibacillus sp. RU4T]
MFLALREIRHSKLKYALITTIMLLVSFLVLFVTGLAQGLSYANASSVVNMKADYFIVQQGSDSRLARSAITPEQAAAAKKAAGEEAVQLLGVRMASLQNEATGAKLDAALMSVQPEGWLAPPVVEGTKPAAGTAGAIVVDRKLAESGVGLGTKLTDTVTGRSWTVAGFVKDESYSHTPAAFVSPAEWSQLQQSGRESGYNAIAFRGSQADAEALQGKLPGTELLAKKQIIQAIPGYSEEQGTLVMMIAFLFVISAFVLAVFFYVMTIQKTSQFGILKAIGSRTGYLSASVLWQVLLLAAASLTGSLLLIWGMRAAMPATVPFQLDAGTTAFTCGLFLLTSIVGSLLSVIKVARTDALDAIGRSA